MMHQRYNLLIITPDQLRADYLGCYGHPTIGTYNIDSLAQKGLRFKNCYCAAPLCGPSRISFATSTYFSEHNHRDYGATISSHVPNLITSLKKSGYRTGMFGKNHLFTPQELPSVWDELDDICLGNCDNHPKYKHSFSSFTMEDDHPYNITGRLTDEAIDFMKRSSNPFVAWINYQDPHPAFACPKPYDTLFSSEEVVLPQSYWRYQKDRQPVRNEVWRLHSKMELCDENEMRRTIATYMGQIRYVDDSVGRMVSALKQSGKDKNTVILFFSDHGELLGDYQMTHKLPVFYDSLSRIPAIMVHPDGRWTGDICNGLVEEVDLAPTLLELLGISIPPTMAGTSWAGALSANISTVGKKSVLCEAGLAFPTCKKAREGIELKAPFSPTSYGCGAMLRQGSFKLSIYHDDLCELYDLSSDPNELNNLYDNPTYAAIQSDLTLQLLKRVMSVKVRDVGDSWDCPDYPYDVRRLPLETATLV